MTDRVPPELEIKGSDWESLPQNIKDELAILILKCRRIIEETEDGGDIDKVKAEIAVQIGGFTDDFDQKVQDGLAEWDRETERDRVKALQIEGYRSLRSRIHRSRPIEASISEVFDLAMEGKIAVQIEGRDWAREGRWIVNSTADETECVVIIDDAVKALEFRVKAVNLPNHPLSRRLLAQLLRRNTDEWARTDLTLKDIEALIENGNFKRRGQVFGDEHPRASEVLKLKAGSSRFCALITKGDKDFEIEIYLTP